MKLLIECTVTFILLVFYWIKMKIKMHHCIHIHMHFMHGLCMLWSLQERLFLTIYVILQPTVPAAGRRGTRVGNIGHITRIFNKIAHLAHSQSHITKYLQVSFVFSYRDKFMVFLVCGFLISVMFALNWIIDSFASKLSRC